MRKYEILSLNLQRHLRSIGLSELASDTLSETLPNADKAFVKDTESKSELKKVTAEKDRLLKKVGQLTIDCDFFAKACEDAGLKVR